MPDYALGRREAPDGRDRNYPMRALLVRRGGLPPPRRFRYWTIGPVLDQGAAPSCVGHGWRQWMTTSPTRTKSGPDALTIYQEAQKIDEWPGEDYAGTSVRAGVKYLQGLGRVAEYRWASTVEEMMGWLSERGPVVIGVNWFTGFLTPAGGGLIVPTGKDEGGHCVLLYGYNRTYELFRGVNSWGRSWGSGGRFNFSFDTMRLLLGMGADVCAAVEVPGGGMG